MEKKPETRPFDLLNLSNHGVPKNVQEQRLDLCKACKHFKPQIAQCSICKCIMPLKVKLKDSWCPIGYWIQYKSPE